MLDRSGVVVSWNVAERFNGYVSAGESSHSSIRRRIKLKENPNAPSTRQLARAVSLARAGEFARGVTGSGMREEGRIIGFAKVTRDISAQKDAEHTLDRTISALNQAQKMEAFGQLTGGLAHDFNNVLAAVLGSLELLRNHLPSEPKIDRLLENAVQGARRGTALTHRMLAFSRRQDLVPEAIHLPSLVRGMITLLEPALGSKVTLETRFPSRHNSIFTDANQLEMAVLYLAVNARDAMPDGGVIVIAVREERLAPGQVPSLTAGAYTCLSVKASGTGMDPATLSRAMEPFYTTKGTALDRLNNITISYIADTVKLSFGG